MLSPPAQAKVYNVVLATKYSISVAFILKGLDTPAIDGITWNMYNLLHSLCAYSVQLKK